MNGAKGFIERREWDESFVASAGVSSDGKIIGEADTAQCVHCGGHFPINPKHLITRRGCLSADDAKMLDAEQKNANRRWYCGKCNGPICGPGCAVCVPVEQLLENIERNRPLDFVIIQTGWTPSQEGSVLG